MTPAGKEDPKPPRHYHVRRTDRCLWESFCRFWAIYPLKKGKKAAWAKWRSLKPDSALVDEIIAAVGLARFSKQWQEGFIPNPATYIHQARWEDGSDAPGGLPDPAAAPHKEVEPVPCTRYLAMRRALEKKYPAYHDHQPRIVKWIEETPEDERYLPAEWDEYEGKV